MIFKQGEEKFAREFDAVEFVRTQRKLKMMLHSLMDQSERFLAPYQKLNTISLNDESNDSLSNDPAYTKIPKLLSDFNSKSKHSKIVDDFFVICYLCWISL